MIYFSPALATVEQLKGLPETFIIVGSLDLFCGEDMDYAKKLMQAGVPAELHVEPGVPHSYDSLAGTSQVKRLAELRDHAVARMLGKLKMAEAPDQGLENEGFLKYFLDLINMER